MNADTRDPKSRKKKMTKKQIYQVHNATPSFAQENINVSQESVRNATRDARWESNRQMPKPSKQQNKNLSKKNKHK